MRRLNKNYRDFIYLLACGLNSRKASEDRARQMDFKTLLKIAKHQNLVNVAYEPIKEFCEDAEWIEAYEQGIRRSMLFDEERKAIYKFMDDKKIWHASLKGVVLQDMYPVFGMRQMSDNDILFDKNFEATIQEFMTARGYKLESGEIHDAYRKEPIYYFEMHKRIKMRNASDDVNDYFGNIETRLDAAGASYLKSMSNVDFYAHTICHFKNHLVRHYGGLKYLCDIYVLNNSVMSSSDRENFETIAEKIGIQNGEATYRSLVNKIFNTEAEAPALTDAEFKVLNECIQNGEYGNFQNYTKSKIKENIRNPKKMAKLVKTGLKTWGLKNIIQGLKK